MRRLLPVILAILGLAAGVGAGLALRPAAEPVAAVAMADGTPQPVPQYRPAPAESEVLRLPNQFLIPLITEGRVEAMVILALALELLPGHGIELPSHEPRMRAILLQLLFDYANLGGFEGVFTRGEQLLGLRRILAEAMQAEFGDKVHDVLITDLVRHTGN